MLRGIHKATSNWFGRIITGIILGLIAISFAVWGIGDIFQGFGQSTLAKIGGTEIGVEQFRQNYNDRVQQLSRRLGRPITPDQARALGLPRQLLGQVLAEAALDEEANKLGLGLTDEEIARRIMSEPAFAGPTGQFDRARFEQIIRQAGYTEARFVAEQRRTALRREIAESIAGGITASKAAVEMQNQFLNEERKIEFMTLDREQAGEIGEPSPEQLKAYFEDRKVVFRAPEYREIELLVLSPQDEAIWATVSDEAAKKAYEERREKYVTPERRDLQQIVFPNAEEARAAAEKIKSGNTTFAQIAQERGLKDSDVNLGTVTKSQIFDPAVANAAFALPADSISDPVAGRFGTVLLHVGKIEPEKVRSYEEVAPELKRELAQEQAAAQVNDQHNQIEDERGAGQPLAEIAQKLGFKTRKIAAIDRSGRDPDGALVAGLPPSPELLPSIYATDMGAENDPLRLQTGGYVWYEVTGITPSRERALDEVKDRVIERWREDEIASRLKAKADELVTKLGTASMKEVAESAGVSVQTVSGLKRNKTADGVPAKILTNVFSTAKDAAATAEGERATQRIVYRVTDIAIPKLDLASPEAKVIEETMRNANYEDLLAQFITRLQTDLGTTINEKSLNQILSGSTSID